MLIVLLDEPGLFVFPTAVDAQREIEVYDADLIREAFDDSGVPYRVPLGLAVGVFDACAIFFHIGLAGVPWLVNVALAKFGFVAALGLLGGGAVAGRISRRQEAERLGSGDAA